MSQQPPREDALLSDLCTICHITPPKYRCPRCGTRTCSLPCTRRHKVWSQCSGVRDPAAYLRRSELATESAFDRDFNFITGVERSMERAERDAGNRGIKIERADDDGNGRKRRRMGDGMGLVKGEAAFLNNAREAGVDVIRAPRGMSRAKENLSRWFPKQKCLNWTVEWIRPGAEKVSRNCLESSTIANAYDRAFPPPREESTARVQLQVQGQLQGQESTQVEFENIQETTPTMPDSTEAASQQQPDSTTQSPLPPNSQSQPETETTVQHHPLPETKPETGSTPSHRDIYFYLHRPRTATRQPVLIPLSPSTTLTDALRGHTVLEFPTIYVLPDSPEVLLTEKRARFLLEEDYLRTEKPALEREAGEMLPGEDGVEDTASAPASGVDLGQVDEKRVMEVLKQDLFGAGHQATA